MADSVVYLHARSPCSAVVALHHPPLTHPFAPSVSIPPLLPVDLLLLLPTAAAEYELK